MLRYRSFVLVAATAAVPLGLTIGCPSVPTDGGGGGGGDPPANRCVGVTCDDGNACTVDSCESATGACSNIPLACRSGEVCDPDTGDCGAVEVSFDGETVRAPESTILSGGVEYEDEAPVSAEGLAAVVKDGETYLYHPGLGDAALSHYNSRRAIGFFIARFSEDVTAAKMVGGVAARLAIDESRTLATGATVQRFSVGTYRVTNEKVRWLAVKSSAMDGPVFLPPRDIFITNFIQIADEIMQWWQNGYIEDENARVILVGPDPVETYGSVVAILSSPLRYLDLDLKDSIQEAISHDRDLFTRVNAVGFLAANAEAFQQILGLLPVVGSCLNSSAVGAALNAFEIDFVDAITGDEHLREQLAEQLEQGFAQEVATCALSKAGPYGMAIATAVQILSGLDWVIEDGIIAKIHVMTTRAYDSVEGISLDENQGPVVDAGVDQTIVWPNDTVDLLAHVTDDGLPTTSSLSGSWAVDSGSGTVTFSDPGSANTTATFGSPGTYVLSFSVSDGDKTDSDSLVVTVVDDETPPSCSVAPSSYDFGTVQVGSSGSKTFTIKNTGGGTLTGSVSASCSQFSLQFGSGGSRFTLAPNDVFTFMVWFEPTSSGHHTCTINTGSDCPNLSATGVGGQVPSCSVTPSSLNFGTVDIGSLDFDTVVIRNTGGGTLTGNVSESCSQFRLQFGSDGLSSYSLGPNEVFTFGVFFEPTSSGTKNCTINTGSDCPNVSATGVGG